MAHRSFSSTLVVLTIALLILSLISSCVAAPKFAPKLIPKPIVTKPKPVPPVITKPTETPVSVATKSIATVKASSSTTTSSIASQSIGSITSSIVTKSSVTPLSSTSSSVVSQKNATLSPPVTTSSASSTALPTNSTSLSAADPILPSSPLDLSNDPNDGKYFSTSIASREFLTYGYDEGSNGTVVRRAKWTKRRGNIPVHGELLDANLHKRVRRPIPTVCGAAANTGNAETYQLDCAKFPNICLNACFFIACKPGAAQAAVAGLANTLEVTLDRNNDGRASGECRGNNKCSFTTQPRVASGWGKMSQADRQCDEFPFNVVRPGGVLAATRCVDGEENGDQGNDFKFFINAQRPYTTNANGVARTRIPDCNVVRVTPINIPAGSLCLAATAQRPQLCAAASPGHTAAGAAQDLNRQE